MSDKAWSSLCDIDREVQQALGPAGPENEGTRLKIEFVSGFEMFNTRPFHNYECWGSGWRVSDGDTTAQMEDLDDAVRLFVRRHNEKETT